MKGLILAAGEGTRMLPLTETRPKSLIPVANKPILEHIIGAFKAAGITDLVIIQGPDKKVEEFIGNGSNIGVNLKYAVQEESLGTAHAVGIANKFLDEDFIVTNGDDLIGPEAIKRLKEAGAPSICIAELDDVSAFGAVEVDGDSVKAINEKTGKNEKGKVNTGAFALPVEISEVISQLEKSERGEYELTDAVMNLGGLKWVQADFWLPIGYPWNLLSANKYLLDSMPEKNEAEIEEGATIKGKLIAGKDTLIRSGTYIEGPVLIGENCTIGPNCYLRPYTTLGNNCKVGQSVEVKNSIVMDNTYLPHQNYAGDSIIGFNCNIAAGTIIANLRHDNENIKFEVNGELIDTGLRKFGAVIGDGVKTGVGSIIFPGRRLGSNSSTRPGELVEKNLEKESGVMKKLTDNY